MSKFQRTQLLGTAQVKRSSTEHTTATGFGSTKRTKYSTSITEIDEIENMTDTAAATTNSQKRANFSALTVTNPNGVTNKISPSLANAKPGSAKKLVIKNFKSK